MNGKSIDMEAARAFAEIKTGHGFDTYFLLGEKTEWALYGQNVSSHPWKERHYPQRRICELTQEQAKDLSRLTDEANRARQVEHEARRLHNADVEAWKASLSGRKFGGLTIGCGGFFCDQYGNLIARLPNDIRTDAELERAAAVLGDDFIE
jgi:hypothetical protein